MIGIIRPMHIVPNPKKHWFKPGFDVRFDNPQELQDVATHGTLLPFPTIAGLRTLAVATSTDVEYPLVVKYSQNQLIGIVDGLSVAASQTEVVADAEAAQRLVVMSGIIRTAIENSL